MLFGDLGCGHATKSGSSSHQITYELHITVREPRRHVHLRVCVVSTEEEKPKTRWSIAWWEALDISVWVFGWFSHFDWLTDGIDSFDDKIDARRELAIRGKAYFILRQSPFFFAFFIARQLDYILRLTKCITSSSRDFATWASNSRIE